MARIECNDGQWSVDGVPITLGDATIEWDLPIPPEPPLNENELGVILWCLNRVSHADCLQAPFSIARVCEVRMKVARAIGC